MLSDSGHAVRSGHESALWAFNQLVVPAAERFGPDLILVSAGFDAHYKDPLARLTFQSPTYHALAVQLKALANRLCGAPRLHDSVIHWPCHAACTALPLSIAAA